VINADDKSAATLRELCKVEQLTYGIRDDGADYHVVDIRAEAAGTLMRLETPTGPCELWTPLIGEYSVYNIAAAATVTLRLGVPPETVSRALRGFRGVPGRLQRVDEGQGFQVVVDFAHTPNALRAVLTTLRPRTPGNLIVVFGHPGERDRQNRRDVAQTAAELADFLVLTYDDPYNEDPLAVLDQIEDAVRETGRRAPRDYQRFDTRPDGIAAALERAAPGDTVLIAGRGHLGYTVVRGQKSPLDDVDLARRALRRLRSAPGVG
jgi:UDP-N-acetylmuramoyl-L-alanyl-D-glutamate--2,6-diaminopimelate ligase